MPSGSTVTSTTQRRAAFRGLRGSLAGFRFPDRAGGLNVAGYHFHFISEDRSVGGHLLECRISRGELRVDHESSLKLELPAGVGAASPDISAAQQDALRRAERGQGGARGYRGLRKAGAVGEEVLRLS